MKSLVLALVLSVLWMVHPSNLSAQDLPIRYATLELFTNTPCPICASQNPGLFSRLANYEGKYHLVGFYPGSPYSNCIFYQANIPQNTTRVQHYAGNIFGSPTVALNGIDFKSSSGVTNAVLANLTGGTSWLHVDVEETTGASRSVTIRLEDVVGGSLNTGRLFAVIVEREILYNAPNGETVHHNVFRRFLTNPTGENIDLSSGQVAKTYQYDVHGTWNADQTYVIAWLSDPGTKEIFNSGTKFDPDFTSAVDPVEPLPALSIYPNPASTEVTVTLPSEVVFADLDVFDQQGRLVHAFKANSGPQIKIDITHLTQGKYFVRLKADQKLYTGSFEIIF